MATAPNPITDGLKMKTLVGLFSLVPLVAFGLYGGAIADTVDRRKLGLGSACGSAVLSVALATAAFAGLRSVQLTSTV